ncbi:hypothetical protein OIE64_22585 [Streptomyces brevispora]|uniref:Uncharacterized protein n=1 Tax=Streptomyces brevispora TaxID=887462 RepID=A0A561UW93_9ACTN|nr:hypothetical protein [Streptomyces brevispora]MBO0917762.1 hypothetical protein [Streptomyces laculatispora]TWG03620.1 hypothetical protein FHX80_112054 [Streptomyces brevispora]WSC15347.1 hypothetical protein OIE64_22585 [Streptomyces brevispora]
MSRTTPSRPIDIERVFPDLAVYRRTATRLHPRPGAPEAGDSSVGGLLLWPADELWPVCRERHRRGYGERTADVRLRRRILAEAWSRVPAPGQRPGPTDEEGDLLRSLKRGRHAPSLGDTDPTPLLAVAQLFRRDVLDLGGPTDHDLLQILWCPFDGHHGRHEPAVTLVWRRSSEAGGVLAVQPEPEVVGSEGYVPASCTLDPEQVVEHPDIEVLPDGLRERIDAWEGDEEDLDEDSVLYRSDLSVAPGWKAGGFASWHGTGRADVLCSCGARTDLLVTVASKEWDGGSRSWIPSEDRAASQDMDANTPTQVTVGRWGSMNVFLCQADFTHPPQLSLQG